MPAVGLVVKLTDDLDFYGFHCFDVHLLLEHNITSRFGYQKTTLIESG